jgi:hypothetical protein
MTDNPMRPTETGHVSQASQCGTSLDRARHASRRQSPGGGGVECTVAQTAVVHQAAAGTATTNTVDIPRRWLRPVAGYARPDECSAI